MHYGKVEIDFVRRTLELLKQYDRFVRPVLPAAEHYDVTLLVNSLVGLIVVPFENLKRVQRTSYPDLCGADETPITELTSDWGLRDLHVEHFTENGKSLDLQHRTLRKTFAMFRHSIAHARFGDGCQRIKPEGMSIQYKASEFNPLESTICCVHLVNEDRQRGINFHVSIPVESLRVFAIRVANAFLATRTSIG